MIYVQYIKFFLSQEFLFSRKFYKVLWLFPNFPVFFLTIWSLIFSFVAIIYFDNCHSVRYRITCVVIWIILTPSISTVRRKTPPRKRVIKDIIKYRHKNKGKIPMRIILRKESQIIISRGTWPWCSHDETN